MAKQIINLGTAGNLSTGDTIRDAFDKVNDNFNELYVTASALQGDDAIDVNSVNNRRGNVQLNINDTKYSVDVLTASATASAGGLYVLTADLSLALPTSASVADSIKISNLSQVSTCFVDRNGHKILGVDSNLTLDNRYSSFELVYTGTDKGWVIIGQN